MANLTIIARIEAQPGQAEAVKQAALKLIEPTRAEAGCIEYRLQQDNENPDLFLMVEVWESRELWQDHMAMPHLKAFVEETKDTLLGLVVNEMTEIA